MIVWGGQDANGDLATGARYDPGQDTWQTTASTLAAAARDSHRAVWAEGLMIVWGGEDDVSAISTGGRYALGLETDADLDGVMICEGDCDDTNGQVWAAPGEATSLILTLPSGPGGGALLTWSPPTHPGGTGPLVYDLLRSDSPADFVNAAACLSSGIPGTSTTDTQAPAAGAAFFYLPRADNACPSGAGSLGTDWLGTQRSGRTCP